MKVHKPVAHGFFGVKRVGTTRFSDGVNGLNKVHILFVPLFIEYHLI